MYGRKRRMTMVHEMRLNDRPFEMIKEGKKTVELRLYDEKRQKINVGDDIIFTNISDKRKLAVRVRSLYRYASFEQLFSEIPLKKCGNAENDTIAEAAAGMKKFYSEEMISKYGVLGIEVEVVDLEGVLHKRDARIAAEIDELFPDGMK